MEMLVVLLLLVGLNLAVWRGWGTDSRDNQNWDPGRYARQRSRRERRPDPVDPAPPSTPDRPSGRPELLTGGPGQ